VNLLPKVALHITSLQQGGAERITINLAEGLAERGLNIDLLYCQQGTFPKEEMPKNVNFIHLKASNSVKSVSLLKNYLTKSRPAILLSALHQPSVASIIARSRSKTNTKIVVAIHNTVSQEVKFATNWRRKVMPIFARKLYPLADGIICVSKTAADDASQYLSLPRNRIEAIYNPVVTQSLMFKIAEESNNNWLDDQSEYPTFIAVGRLNNEKNFEMMLKALQIVNQTKKARLIILGEGPDRPKLESLVKSFGLEEVVDLAGFMQNPYTFIRKARAILLTSHHEGLPTVLIEALAAGTPIISVDCPSGPREILDGGGYGRLVTSLKPEAFSQAILDELGQARIPPPAESWQPYKAEVAFEHYETYLSAIAGFPLR